MYTLPLTIIWSPFAFNLLQHLALATVMFCQLLCYLLDFSFFVSRYLRCLGNMWSVFLAFSLLQNQPAFSHFYWFLFCVYAVAGILLVCILVLSLAIKMRKTKEKNERDNCNNIIYFSVVFCNFVVPFVYFLIELFFS